MGRLFGVVRPWSVSEIAGVLLFAGVFVSQFVYYDYQSSYFGKGGYFTQLK